MKVIYAWRHITQYCATVVKRVKHILNHLEPKIVMTNSVQQCVHDPETCFQEANALGL